MTQKRFNSLAILNFHKHETGRIDLVSVGNDLIAKHHERYSFYFQKIQWKWLCLNVAYVLPCA